MHCWHAVDAKTESRAPKGYFLCPISSLMFLSCSRTENRRLWTLSSPFYIFFEILSNLDRNDEPSNLLESWLLILKAQWCTAGMALAHKLSPERLKVMFLCPISPFPFLSFLSIIRQCSQSSVNYPSIIRQLSVNHPSIIRQSSVNYPSIIRRLSVNAVNTTYYSIQIIKSHAPKGRFPPQLSPFVCHLLGSIQGMDYSM